LSQTRYLIFIVTLANVGSFLKFVFFTISLKISKKLFYIPVITFLPYLKCVLYNVIVWELQLLPILVASLRAKPPNLFYQICDCLVTSIWFLVTTMSWKQCKTNVKRIRDVSELISRTAAKYHSQSCQWMSQTCNFAFVAEMGVLNYRISQGSAATQFRWGGNVHTYTEIVLLETCQWKKVEIALHSLTWAKV